MRPSRPARWSSEEGTPPLGHPRPARERDTGTARWGQAFVPSVPPPCVPRMPTLCTRCQLGEGTRDQLGDNGEGGTATATTFVSPPPLSHQGRDKGTARWGRGFCQLLCHPLWSPHARGGDKGQLGTLGGWQGVSPTPPGAGAELSPTGSSMEQGKFWCFLVFWVFFALPPFPWIEPQFPQKTPKSLKFPQPSNWGGGSGAPFFRGGHKTGTAPSLRGLALGWLLLWVCPWCFPPPQKRL